MNVKNNERKPDKQGYEDCCRDAWEEHPHQAHCRGNQRFCSQTDLIHILDLLFSGPELSQTLWLTEKLKRHWPVEIQWCFWNATKISKNECDTQARQNISHKREQESPACYRPN